MSDWVGKAHPGWNRVEISHEQAKAFADEFRRKARFLVDENMGEDAAAVLRELGCWAKYVGDVGLCGRSDQEVSAYACKKGLIILTHDSYFLDDHQFPFHRNPGVIVLPGAEGDGSLEIALADVIRIVAPFGEAHVGSKISVTQDRIWTVRRFDKEFGTHVSRRVKLGGAGVSYEWQD